uniref:Uncharacterized protein n=1 Tax=Setaria viridis TaxID=4556 RepID=A0A4U6VCQ9_SETVI|nr:hypothetical protein SEVIR_3G244300v2 [Setaria viridis]
MRAAVGPLHPPPADLGSCGCQSCLWRLTGMGSIPQRRSPRGHGSGTGASQIRWLCGPPGGGGVPATASRPTTTAWTGKPSAQTPMAGGHDGGAVSSGELALLGPAGKPLMNGVWGATASDGREASRRQRPAAGARRRPGEECGGCAQGRPRQARLVDPGYSGVVHRRKTAQVTTLAY